MPSANRKERLWETWISRRDASKAWDDGDVCNVTDCNERLRGDIPSREARGIKVQNHNST